MIEGLSCTVESRCERKRCLILRNRRWILPLFLVNLAQQVVSAEGGSSLHQSTGRQVLLQVKDGIGKVAVAKIELAGRVKKCLSMARLTP